MQQRQVETGAGLDDDLTAVIQRAAWLGDGVSFHSLFVAILVGPEPSLEPLQRAAARIGPVLDDVVRAWQASWPSVQGLAQRAEQARTRPLASPPSWPVDVSDSAQRLLAETRSFAQETASPRAGVRHLVAAYLYASGGHDRDLTAWQLDPRRWSEWLFRVVVRDHDAELRAWAGLHRRARQPARSSQLQATLGWASALAGAAGRDQLDGGDLIGGILLEGRAEPTSAYASAWLHHAVGASADAMLAAWGSLPSAPSTTPLPLHADLDDVATVALVLALGAQDGREHLRHWLGALLARPGAAPAVWARSTVKPRELLQALRAWVHAAGAIEAEHWDAVLRGLDRTVAAAGFRNDGPGGIDRLDFQRDVEALAAVIAHRETRPPLSVGLFGDWGSGKSFFMSMLRDDIGQLAEQSRVAGAASERSEYCDEIVQIDFNAWQFMDADLWASLATHIFERLEAALTRDDQPSAARYTAQLASVREEVEQLRDRRSVLERVRGELDGRRSRLEEQRLQRPRTSAEVAATIQRRIVSDEGIRGHLAEAKARLGLPGAALALDQARAEQVALTSTLRRVAVLWDDLKASPSRLILAAVILALPVAATVVPFVVDGVAGAVVPVVAWLTSVLGGLVAAGRRLRATVVPALTQIEAAVTEAREIELQERRKLTEEEQQLAAQHAAIAQQLGELERQGQELDTRKAEIEARIADLEHGRNFKRFVLERAASDDYRSQLGVISRVHADFQRLSELLGDRSVKPHVERIVLYVDDLDRCPPKRVVEVLQAIHLILSLPLFVVVVGVDSRWLLQSLEAYYSKQFPARDPHLDAAEAWEAKPQHYLEKIFQIALRVPKMPRGGSPAIVDDLLRAQVGVRAPAPVGVPGPSAPDGATPAPTGDARPPVAPPPPVAPLAVAPGRARRTATAPPSLELRDTEVRDLEHVAALIGSPRAAKRLINLYRLVRAGLDGDELDRLLAGEHRLLQVCLAAAVGEPIRSAELFADVTRGRIGDAAAMRATLSTRSVADREWARLASALDGLDLADWQRVTLAMGRASRFSFEFAPRNAGRDPAAAGAAP